MTSNPASNFYVYAWFREDTGEAFYIGKGRRDRDSARKTNPIVQKIVAKLAANGHAYSVRRLFENLTEAQAFETERAEIAARGRIDLGTGCLANLTDGGEGASGNVQSAESRAKKSRANIVRYRSESERKKQSEAILAYYTSPEARVKKSLEIRRRLSTPEARRRMSAVMTSRYAVPAERLRASEAGLRHFSNPEARDRRSLSLAKSPPPSSNSSGYKGVSFMKTKGVWRASINNRGQAKHLGVFPTKEQAARAYDAAALEKWGAGNCYVNFPDSVHSIRGAA